MTRGRKWQVAAMVALAAVSAWTGQARADFAFGTPVNLGPGINSSEREYDPAISADGLELYFQSYRGGGYGACDLYVAKRATTGDPWYGVQNLGSAINTAGAESGPSLSSDGLTLYFNSDRSGGLGGQDLYMTTRANRSDPWGKPVNLGPVVNSTFGEINPNISSDGLSLFFSDVEGDGAPVRPGGKGGPDIWVSTRASVSDPWGPPVNVGTPVNGAWTDGSPDISNDGLLLFLNYYRGDNTFFDVYVATRKTPQDPWNAPVSLGAPVNTNTWEGNAELSADGRTLYFVSCCRPGGHGATDIWQVAIDPIADLNGDGKVDERDVQIMTESFGTNDSLCDIGPTPFGDGVVDMKDLAVLTEYASAHVLDPSLAACWGFDETEGDIACDSTERWNGTLVGNPVWQPDAGAVGGAIQLDGVDDHVLAGAPIEVNRGVWSLIAWVKGGKPGQAILSQSNGVDWLVADPDSGALRTDLRSATRTSRTLSSQAIITDGNWHRIGATWDGETRKLFVDGKLVAEDTQDFIKPAYGNVHIGADKNCAAGSFWSGLIDDVRIYDRVVKP